MPDVRPLMLRCGIGRVARVRAFDGTMLCGLFLLAGVMRVVYAGFYGGRGARVHRMACRTGRGRVHGMARRTHDVSFSTRGSVTVVIGRHLRPVSAPGSARCMRIVRGARIRAVVSGDRLRPDGVITMREDCGIGGHRVSGMRVRRRRDHSRLVPALLTRGARSEKESS